MADAIARVKVRLSGREEVPSDDELAELLQTITDRVCMRIGVASLPDAALSIVVDATVKAVNLRFEEGVTSESEGQGGTMSTAFVADVLAEYADEIAGLREQVAGSSASTRSKVRFL